MISPLLILDGGEDANGGPKREAQFGEEVVVEVGQIAKLHLLLDEQGKELATVLALEEEGELRVPVLGLARGWSSHGRERSMLWEFAIAYVGLSWRGRGRLRRRCSAVRLLEGVGPLLVDLAGAEKVGQRGG